MLTRTLRRHLVAAAMAALASGGALGQVTYRVGNNPQVQPGTADFTISLGAVSADTTVRIFDAGQVANQAPTASAGRVTITGSLASGSNAIVSVFLASRFESPSFATPTLRVDSGLVNLSTLTVSDEPLRARTRVIISLAGSLTGDPLNPSGDHVSVGQIFRLDVAGALSGNVLATAVDGAFGDGFQTIEFIRAAALTGNLRVVNDEFGIEQASIRTVRVFDTAGAGITGDIHADKIGTIWTAGPIGTTTRASVIRAEVSIGEIRAVNESGATDLDRDFAVSASAGFASMAGGEQRALRIKTLGDISGMLEGAEWTEIEAGGNISATVSCAVVGHVVDFGMFSGGMTAGGSITGSVTPGADGVITSMTAGGNISSPVIDAFIIDRIVAAGSIASGINVNHPNADFPDGEIRTVSAGTPTSPGSITGSIVCGTATRITAYGVIDAPINISSTLQDRIVGTSIRQPIFVGYRTYGSIVAAPRSLTGVDSDPMVGTINSVDVGHGAVIMNPFPENEGSRGLGGRRIDSNGLPPSNARTLAEWIETPGIDSVVRASTRIGALRAADMTMYAIRGATHSVFYDYPTRVESPLIGTLDLDAMSSGVIWSGRLDGIGSVPGTRDPSLDYCKVDNLTIGTMGSSASLYIKDFGTASFTGDVFGDINVPRIAPTETIRIAGSLGEACCSSASVIPAGCFRAPLTISESSPRAVACRGRSLISIREPLGLQGQITINQADGTPAGKWRGECVVNAGDPV